MKSVIGKSYESIGIYLGDNMTKEKQFLNNKIKIPVILLF